MKPTEKQLEDAPWMRHALKYVGQKEIAGKNGHNQVIVSFFAKAKNPQIKNDETAWCSAFVNAIMFEAGWQGTWNLMAKSWLKWKYGDVVTVPRYGDIVIFDRTSDPAFGHVAFFEKWDSQYIYVLGGNQGNMVKSSPYLRSRLRGFRRPNPLYRGKPTTPDISQVDKPVVTPPEAVTGAGGAVVAAKPFIDGDWLVGAMVLITFAAFAGYMIWKRRRA